MCDRQRINDEVFGSFHQESRGVSSGVVIYCHPSVFSPQKNIQTNMEGNCPSPLPPHFVPAPLNPLKQSKKLYPLFLFKGSMG